MSFITQLQNKPITIEQKQQQANSYVDTLQKEITDTQSQYASYGGISAAPKYIQQRVNNLQREINQVRSTTWTTPEQYKESIKTPERKPSGEYIPKELPSQIKQETPTTQQEFIQSLTQRQENLKAKSEGREPRKVTVTKGLDIVVAPSSAKISEADVSSLESYKQSQLKAKEKDALVSFGRIPEKGAELKKYSQLTEQEKRELNTQNLNKALYTTSLYATAKQPAISNRTSFYDTFNSWVDNLASKKTKWGEKNFFSEVAQSYAGQAIRLGKEVVVGTGKLLYAPNIFNRGEGKPVIDLGQSKIFASKNILADPDVRTAATVYSLGALGASSKILSAGIKWTFGALGGYTIVTQPKTSENIATGLFYSTPLLSSLGKRGFQSANKLFNPKFKPIETSNIEYVEGVTIPQKVNVLRGYEGKTVPTVHTTLSPQLKIGSELQPAAWEKVTGWRANIGQRNFYTSSPVKAAEGLKPAAYLGYVGIGEGYSASPNVEFSLLPKTPKVFIFRDTQISSTPRAVTAKGIKATVGYQSTKAGTYVPGENLFRMSTEGQFTTSAGIEGEPLIRIAENPQGELAGKFTYYNVKEPFPKILGGDKAPKPVKAIWDFLTAENKKLKFVEAKFETIKESTASRGNALDLGKYAESMTTKSYSISDVGKSIYPYSTKKQEERPSKSKQRVLYSSVSIVNSQSPVYNKSQPTYYSSKDSSSKKLSYGSSALSKSLSSIASQSSSSMQSSSVSSSPSSLKSSSIASSVSKVSRPSQSQSSSSRMSSSLLSSISSRSSFLKSSYSPSTSKPSYDYTSKSPSPFFKSSSSNLSKAFRVFLGSGKKEIKIGEGLTRGEALKLGASKALQSIKARFRIEEAGVSSKQDISFAPSSKLFKESKTVKGQEVLTPNVFIQRRGQRLFSRSEVSELQSFRKLAQYNRKPLFGAFKSLAGG